MLLMVVVVLLLLLMRVEGVLRTPEAVDTFLERIEMALEPKLQQELQTLKTTAADLPSNSFQPLRLPLEIIWQRAVEMVERLTGFTLVPVRPAPGETWHWSVLKDGSWGGP
ncbi:hypothetical protein EBH_0010860 [Eimeria brunetti]|uniref:Uncharacterized protein n=1 Tax=Eimeria brunetti TaxID=51314 RepID=U6LA88_9EIME|nr:hypothetical protein EBH_0010860 [Eimeria brunetti]